MIYTDEWYMDGETKKYREAIGAIFVRNERQKAIFQNEILGQLSDGWWENDEVDLEFWYGLKVIVNQNKYGIYAKRISDRYTFDLFALMDLTDRMKAYSVLGEMGYNKEEIEAISSTEWKNYNKDEIIKKCPALKDRLPEDIKKTINEKVWQYTEQEYLTDIEQLQESMRIQLRKYKFIDDFDESELI